MERKIKKVIIFLSLIVFGCSSTEKSLDNSGYARFSCVGENGELLDGLVISSRKDFGDRDIRIETPCKNGVIDGTQREYEDNELRTERIYQNGEIILLKSYFNGQLSGEGDKERLTFYHHDGSISYIKYEIDNGTRKKVKDETYDADGNLTGYSEYQDGKLIYDTYNIDGAIYEGRYDENGLQISYSFSKENKKLEIVIKDRIEGKIFGKKNIDIIYMEINSLEDEQVVISTPVLSYFFRDIRSINILDALVKPAPVFYGGISGIKMFHDNGNVACELVYKNDLLNKLNCYYENGKPLMLILYQGNFHKSSLCYEEDDEIGRDCNNDPEFAKVIKEYLRILSYNL